MQIGSRWGIFIPVLVLYAGSAVAVTAVGPTSLQVSDADTVLWTSVTTVEPTLRAVFPSGAARASLTIEPRLVKGPKVTAVLTPSSPTFAWRPFAGAAPERDEVYALELAFADAAGQTLAVETAQLAVRPGAFGGIRVVTDKASDAWRQVMGDPDADAVAIAYDVGWLSPGAGSCSFSVSHGGHEETFVPSGHSGLHVFDFRPRNVWRAGAYDLALSAGGVSVSGAFERCARGAAILIR